MENFGGMTFEEFFRERIKERGLTLEKLSQITGIAIKHLASLCRGDFQKLPSEPYFRGYMIELGEALNFDYRPWWNKIKTGGFVKNSGEMDAPPKNKFARQNIGKLLWISAAALVVAAYLVFRFARIVGQPKITVTYPSENPASAAAQKITIGGKVENASELFVNGESAAIGPDGAWEKTVLLQAGVNSLQITAKKFLGGETSFVEQIVYQPEAATSSFDNGAGGR